MAETPKVIEVAAAVLTDGNGRVLLARRADHLHQGGLWEFPGGKIEPGETLAQALCRELAEELDVRVDAHEPLIRLRHDYADRRVVLHVRHVTAYSGAPRGREGQPLVWAAPERLHEYPMPAADRPIVTALRLPRTYLVTPADPGGLDALLRGADLALARGVRLLQLRIKAAGFPVEAAARVLAQRARQAGARLLINADIPLARALGCGVHLTSAQLMSLRRRPLDKASWVAASCHDPESLERACDLGLDFAVLSPVKPTASHPGAEAIGWSAFADWVRDLPLPVYALGGLGARDLEMAMRHGAQGIAAIRGLWPD